MYVYTACPMCPADSFMYIIFFIQQNLERYLKKEFESQEFLLTYEYVHSIENEIELKIPTDVVKGQEYKVVTYKQCRVS